MSPGTDLGLGPGSQGAAYADWIDGDLVQTWSAWYRDATAPDEPLVSPLFGDFHGVAPIYVQAGGAEFLHESIVRFVGHVQASGGDVTLETWDHMPHVFQSFAGIQPEADQALRRLGEVRALRLP